MVAGMQSASRRQLSAKARDATMQVSICVLLFFGVWLSRAVAPGAIVTWDEPAWVYRSVKFLLALGRGDLQGTLLSGHPGVVTMWCGALSLAWQRWITGAVSSAQLAAIDALPTLDVHNADVIRQLVALLPAAKAGIAILHAAIAVVLYLLLCRLLDRSYALVAMLFLAADPYYLALSRVLHIDALASGFMAIAIVSVLIHVRRANVRAARVGAAGGNIQLATASKGARLATRRYLFISAVAAGLATLTKSYGVLVTPFVGLALLITHLRGLGTLRERLRRLLGEFVIWGAVAVLIFVVLWPAVWVSPVNTLGAVFGLSLESASSAGDATAKFFLGRFGVDPGAAFYPVAMFFRTTPLVIVGCLLALAGLVWRSRREEGVDWERRAVTISLLVYILPYVAVITLSKKKFDRYTLPAVLAADILAAVGWAGAVAPILGAFARRAQQGATIWRVASVTIVSLLTLLQSVLLLLPLYPAQYLAYYNPWAGGPQEAVKMIPVGWGEGVEQVADYLASKPNAADLNVVTWAVPAVAPAFPGQVTKPTEDSIPSADYVLLYVSDMQTQDPLVRQFFGEKPEFVARLNGLEYAWLYTNSYYGELSNDINRAAESGDVIVSNMNSAFNRHYQGPLRCSAITGASEEAVAAELQQDTGAAPHLFYLEFENKKDVPAASIKRQLAQSALLLWQKPFVYGTLYYYQLPTGHEFRPVAPSVELAADFADQFALVGCGLARQQVEYRQEVGIALQWRLLQRTTQDYYLFVRLVDAQGEVWGQRDGPLTDSTLTRTSAWQETSSHLCYDTIPLVPGIPPGQYWLVLGLYRLDDLARLTIVAADEQRWTTELRVGPITVTPAIVPPTRDELGIPYPTDLPLGKQIQLLGYDLASAQARSGEDVKVTLFWQCLGTPDRRYEVGLRLVRAGSTLTIFRFSPAGASYPTGQWLPGELLRYAERLRVPPDAASGTYDLFLNLYSDDGQPLAPQDILLTQIQVEHVERTFTAPPIQHPLLAGFGDGVELLGYDLQETKAQPGGLVHLTLYWKALRPDAVSHTVFTHLLDAQGLVRGQHDGVPARGQRPTSDWVEGEIIADPHEIQISADAQTGSLQIEIGLYDPATGRRLQVTRDGATTGQDHVLLPTTITLP